MIETLPEMDAYFERALDYCQNLKLISSAPSIEQWREESTDGRLSVTIQRICEFITQTALLEASLCPKGKTFVRDHFVSIPLMESRLKPHAEKRLDDFSKYITQYLEGRAHRLAVGYVAPIGDALYEVAPVQRPGVDLLPLFDPKAKKQAETQSIVDVVRAEVTNAKGNIARIAGTNSTISKIATFTKNFNWPLIIASIVIPLIPIILLIASAIFNDRHIRLKPEPLPYNIQRQVQA